MEKISAFITSDVEDLVDDDTYQDILKQVAKESLVQPDLKINLLNKIPPERLKSLEFTEAEIYPFHSCSIDCSDVEINKMGQQRLASCRGFSPVKLSIQEIKKLLLMAFSAQNNTRRPYPSGGGLYVVEPVVFMFNENLKEEIKSGCYHFHPISKKLQKIRSISKKYFFEEMIDCGSNSETYPNFVIAYLVHIHKAIFKYRHRGYRHALMEVGSMYQNAINVCQKLELRTSIWGQFADFNVLHALNLEPNIFSIPIMQIFGKGE